MGSTLQIFSPIYDEVYFCRIHKKGNTPSFSVLTFRLFFSPWMVIYTLLKLHILLVFPNISYYHWVDFTDGRHVVHEDTIHLSAFKFIKRGKRLHFLCLPFAFSLVHEWWSIHFWGCISFWYFQTFLTTTGWISLMVDMLFTRTPSTSQHSNATIREDQLQFWLWWILA